MPNWCQNAVVSMMRRLFERYLFPTVALMLLLLPSAVVAEQCDGTATGFWCRMIEFDNRIEGIRRQPVTGGGLEVISFTAHVEQYPMDRSVPLYVAFYLPAGQIATITAAEKDPIYFYGMISKPREWRPDSWQVFGPWDSGVFLTSEATPIRPENLSLIVTLSEGPPQRLAPAILYIDSKPSEIRRYKIVLRSGRTLTSFSYLVEQNLPDGLREVVSYKTDVDKIAGRNFAIYIDPSLLMSGPVRILMTGEVKNRPMRHHMELLFEHRDLAELEDLGNKNLDE